MKVLTSLLAIGTIIAGPVYADCSVPAPPDNIPDGATAALADMVATQKAMREYNDAIKAYTDCLHLEHDSAVAAAGGDKIPAAQKKLLDKQQTDKNNAAVDQAEAVTTRFNEQVRIYKAHSGQPKKG